ncbi:acetyl-CoA carboxylase carboxyltransferase subunit alpha [Ferrovibrio sp.]|jgi:acetyl-CoA carboxylase carboxyl transferase subunit alpha|uniref:acetyl-CoA carboxylase carboxyltransferase subunit alpha n=1 Tax=Ferrovibrio sp. TaxID=1917215 RepID=UPI0035AEE393
MRSYLEFEKPIAELEAKIAELRQLVDSGNTDIAEDLEKLEAKAAQQLQATYARLGAWQKTQVARHQDRPHFADYVAGLIEDFVPLAGDRNFAEDAAIVGGLGRFRGRAVMVMGHEKGRTTESRLKHNFGMAKPEGYRKAIRLMRMADRFRLPVITLVDTAGAYPGVQAEERGQAEAIARAIDCCLDIRVPLVAAIVGEGGSGGAVALAAANRVLMFEHAIYSVISPEGCAAILWNDGSKAQDAAEALRVTAEDLLKLKVVDEIVKEPIGGAHRDPTRAIAALGDALEANLRGLLGQEPGSLREARRRKFLDMGSYGL